MQPIWRFLASSSPPTNRKWVKYYEGTSETDVQTIKRQKKTNCEPCSPRLCKDVGRELVSELFTTSPRNGSQLFANSGRSETPSSQEFRAHISSDEQKSLHQILKHDMVKLFQILGLEEDVQKMAERFLAFIITTNQRVIREPDTTFQAFQISVCWTAASILSKKIDHVESISLARRLPNFNCSNAEAEYEFSKMQFSKFRFVRSESANRQASSKNVALQTKGLKSETMNGVMEPTVSIQQKEKVAEGLLVQDGFVKQALAPMQAVEQTGEGIKLLKKITKSCRKRLASLIEKQLNEVEEVKKIYQEKNDKRKIKTVCRSEVIHKINTSNESVKSDKLQILEDHHRQKLHQYESEMDTTLKDIEARHQAERKEMEKEEEARVQELYGYDFWIKSGLSDNLQFKEAFVENGIEVVPDNNFSQSENNLEEENANVHSSVDTQVLLSQNPGPQNDAAVPGRERVISDNDPTSNSPLTATQINNEAMTFANIAEKTVTDSCVVQGNHFSSAVTIDGVERIATSENAELSVKNPVLQTEADANAAFERDTALGKEQVDEASNSTHIESTTPHSTMNPSVVQTVTNHQNGPSENDKLFMKNPALQTEVDANVEGTLAFEQYTAFRKEQLDKASSCIRIESMGTPSTMNPSVVPVTNQHQVDSIPVSQEQGNSCARLDQLSNQYRSVQTSGIQNTITQNMIPSSHHSVGVPCNVSNLAEPCLPSSGLPCRTTEARVQENQRPLNRSFGATQHPLLHTYLNPLMHNSSQFGNYKPSRSLPATQSGSSKGFDPLQREYERICGESNQLSKNHEEMVSGLKLKCDKEIEEMVALIRNKYDSMLQEVNASHLQKTNEVDHIQRKVAMNIALAEAFRSKWVTPGAQQGWRLSLQLAEPQFSGRLVSAATVGPQTATAQPTDHSVNQSTIQTSTTLAHRNSPREGLNLSMPMSSTSGHTFPTIRPLNSTLRSQTYPTGSHGGPRMGAT